MKSLDTCRDRCTPGEDYNQTYIQESRASIDRHMRETHKDTIQNKLKKVPPLIKTTWNFNINGTRRNMNSESSLPDLNFNFILPKKACNKKLSKFPLASLLKKRSFDALNEKKHFQRDSKIFENRGLNKQNINTIEHNSYDTQSKKNSIFVKKIFFLNFISIKSFSSSIN